MNTIQLTDGYVMDEAIAHEEISPGMLVEMLSTGKVQKHSTEGDFSDMRVAVEDAYQGNTTGDAYAAGARVIQHIQRRGAQCQLILKAGENVTKGAALISDGAGRVIAEGSAASGTTVNQIIGWAEEALNLSASGASDTLIAVRAG
jgi:hypothetical protein